VKPTEQGFTLIELLIATVVVGIIASAVTGAIVLACRTTDVTTNRVSQSADAQLISAYFVTDVQSAEDVSMASAAVEGCGGAPAAGGTDLIRFAWDDPQSPVVHKAASYVLEPVGGEQRLTRRLCSGTATPPPLVSSRPVARYLKPTASAPAGPAAVATCTPSCTVRPATVRLALTAADTTFTYNVEGRTRVSATTTTT
jgi:prepilin-type N-terminal cleavage/methylation domain-containing protein